MRPQQIVLPLLLQVAAVSAMPQKSENVMNDRISLAKNIDLSKVTLTGDRECDAVQLGQAVYHFAIKPKMVADDLTWTTEQQEIVYSNSFRSIPNSQKMFPKNDKDLWDSELTYRVLQYQTLGVCNKNTILGMTDYKLKTDNNMGLLLGSFKLLTFAEIGGQLYYIAASPTQKSIYVVFRGATSQGDWKTASEVTPVNCDFKIYPGAPQDCLIRDGLQQSTQRMMLDPDNGIMLALSQAIETYPDLDIIFSGHSLGGAIAACAALSAKLKIPSLNLRALYTWGQPIVGNAIFTNWLTENIKPDRFIRAVSAEDIVPYYGSTKDEKPPPKQLKDQYRHTPHSPMMYFPNPKTIGFMHCNDETESGCSPYQCKERHWENHSNYGGWRITQRFCLLSRNPQKIEWV